MLYVQLDTNWPDNPKIIRVGWEAAGMHAAIMCVAKRLETDGWVPRVLLARMGITNDHLVTLSTAGLIEESADSVKPHDWHDRNPSQAAIAARKAAKAKAGRKGNHDRWEHPHPFEDCPLCHPETQVVAGCDDDGRTSDSDRIAEHRTATKSETEVGAGLAPAIDLRRPSIPKIPDENRQVGIAACRDIRSSTFGPQGEAS